MLFRKMAIKQREKEILQQAWLLAQTNQAQMDRGRSENSTKDQLQQLDDQTAECLVFLSHPRALIRGLTLCLLEICYNASDAEQSQQLQLHLKYLLYGLVENSVGAETKSGCRKKLLPQQIQWLCDIVTFLHQLQHRDNITVTRCVQQHGRLFHSFLKSIQQQLQLHTKIKWHEYQLNNRNFDRMVESFCQIFMLNCCQSSQQNYVLQNLVEIHLDQPGIIVRVPKERRLEKSKGVNNLNQADSSKKISIEYDARAVISQESLEVFSFEDSEIVARNLFADASCSRSIIEQNNEQCLIIGKDSCQVLARPACSLICSEAQQCETSKLMQLPFRMIQSVMSGSQQLDEANEVKHNTSRDSLSTKFKPILPNEMNKYKQCKSNTVSTSALSTPQQHMLDFKLDRGLQTKQLNTILPLCLLATQPFLRQRVSNTLRQKHKL